MVAGHRPESAEVAADLITYNQEATVGLSIPVEGAIERGKGIITRWELPIPVYVDALIVGDCAQNALDYWASATGLPFALVAANAEPRVVIRAAGPDELNVAAGSGLVYRTFPNNGARLGVVKVLTSEARCSAPSARDGRQYHPSADRPTIRHRHSNSAQPRPKADAPRQVMPPRRRARSV